MSLPYTDIAQTDASATGLATVKFQPTHLPDQRVTINQIAIDASGAAWTARVLVGGKLYANLNPNVKALSGILVLGGQEIEMIFTNLIGSSDLSVTIWGTMYWRADPPLGDSELGATVVSPPVVTLIGLNPGYPVVEDETTGLTYTLGFNRVPVTWGELKGSPTMAVWLTTQTWELAKNRWGTWADATSENYSWGGAKEALSTDV